MDLLISRFKYEEDVEEGGDRWSKPHVATLSLYSLLEVRNCLMSGTVILDLEANSLAQIAGIESPHLSPPPLFPTPHWGFIQVTWESNSSQQEPTLFSVNIYLISQICSVDGHMSSSVVNFTPLYVGQVDVY